MRSASHQIVILNRIEDRNETTSSIQLQFQSMQSKMCVAARQSNKKQNQCKFEMELKALKDPQTQTHINESQHFVGVRNESFKVRC